MGNWLFYAIVFIGCTIAFFAFALEKRRNEKNLKKLTVRINVNGIRGKSTITRLITAILKEAGYHVVGKTTGTAARMIYWNKEEEEEIVRRPRGISIGEQIRVINKAVKAGALGGKLLGAGGGGFIVFYVPKSKQKAVKKALNKLLYVPFKFENSGTEVIYYSPEQFNVEGDYDD